MARNWLASAELPSSLWFYVVHHAAEVCNYFPYKLEDGSYVTPFELVHKTKPDLRVLFKLLVLLLLDVNVLEMISLTNLSHKASP